ncbi:MAG: GHKL domain-containing protein, partial [Desulfobacula sp.]|nr:GHKL domain-containing protein [Desulfobacula sp.]
GSILIATLSSIQYAILIELEYFEIITPSFGHFYLSGPVDENRIIYRIIIIFLSCFAVAILSGILALQLKVAKQDLKRAREHLKRVEKMAAMDEMIAGIAHEINNPLASLSGSIQLLQEDANPGSYEDKLMQIILRETDRLEKIVNDIRLFAKPRIDNAREIKISDAIKEIVQLFLNDPAWNNKINLTMEIKNDIHLLIDPLHLHQILWNLLKNAAQSIKGKGQITISLDVHKNRGAYLIIEDNGIGIQSKDRNHVFDPFYTSKPDGTGLGLPIIHRIIEAYNGIIDFESTPDHGTIFTILFDGAIIKKSSNI